MNRKGDDIYYCKRNKSWNQKNYNNQRSFILPIVLLCSRPSNKEVRNSHNSHRRSISSLAADDDDPHLYPTTTTTTTTTTTSVVGCSGQLNRTNKLVVGVPAGANKTSTSTSKRNDLINFSTITARKSLDSSGGGGRRDLAKFQKLKRFFSSKSLGTTTTSTLAPPTPTAITVAAAAITTSSVSATAAHRSGSEAAEDGRTDDGMVDQHKRHDRNLMMMINVADLDPPLPVIIKKGGCDQMESLWKRRSGAKGAAAVGLQNLQVKSHHNHHCLQVLDLDQAKTL